MLRLCFTIALTAVLAVGCARKEEGRPSAYAMPFSKLAASLENRGFHPILDARYENGGWQILARRGTELVTVRTNASVGHLGAIRRATPGEPRPEPAPEARRLSEIAASVEAAGYAPILEAEFEEDGWEIEALARVEVDLDQAGNIVEIELDVDDDPDREVAEP